MEKHYCIFRISKLKSKRHLRVGYNHNDRIGNINNVDPSKTKDNVNYIGTNGKTYELMFDEELAKLEILGVPQKKIRKDAVLGLEVYMGFSYEANGSFDLDSWAKSSFAWLDKMFNPPNHEICYTSSRTGKEEREEVQNIKHFVLHMDENCPHIHAFIVPINDKGNLSAKFYTETPAVYRNMQEKYAEQMKEFGLSRGEKYSAAYHEDVKEYYSKLKQAVNAELPEPQKDENIYDYYKRANEVHQIAMVHHRDEIVKKDQEIIRIKSEAITKFDNAFKSLEYARDISEAVNQEFDLEEPVDEERVREFINKYRTLEKAIEQHPDRNLAAQVAEFNEAMINWMHMQELECELDCDLDR